MLQILTNDTDSFIEPQYINNSILTSIENILEEEINDGEKERAALKYLVNQRYYCQFNDCMEPMNFQKLTLNMSYYFTRKNGEQDNLLFMQKGDHFETFSNDALTAARDLHIELKMKGSVETVLIDDHQLKRLKEMPDNKVKTITYDDDIEEGQIISSSYELPSRLWDEFNHWGKSHTKLQKTLLEKEFYDLGYYLQCGIAGEFLITKKLTANEKKYFDFIADKDDNTFVARQTGDDFIVYGNHADTVIKHLNLSSSRIDFKGPFYFIKLTYLEYECYSASLELQRKKHYLVKDTQADDDKSLDQLPIEVQSLLEAYDYEWLTISKQIQFRDKLTSLGYYLPLKSTIEPKQIQQLSPNAFMFFQLRKNYANQIILFRVGEQYEAYDINAKFIDQYLLTDIIYDGDLEKVILKAEEFNKLQEVAKKYGKGIRIFEAA